jgi:hypothetical protein
MSWNIEKNHTVKQCLKNRKIRIFFLKRFHNFKAGNQYHLIVNT